MFFFFHPNRTLLLFHRRASTVDIRNVTAKTNDILALNCSDDYLAAWLPEIQARGHVIRFIWYHESDEEGAGEGVDGSGAPAEGAAGEGATGDGAPGDGALLGEATSDAPGYQNDWNRRHDKYDDFDKLAMQEAASRAGTSHL
jgi:hypothetical protein